MNKPFIFAVAYLLSAPSANAQMVDYAATAGAAGLGTGLGAGASKMLAGATSRAMALTPAQLKQVQLVVDQSTNSAVAKEKLGDHSGAAGLFRTMAKR